MMLYVTGWMERSGRGGAGDTGPAAPKVPAAGAVASPGRAEPSRAGQDRTWTGQTEPGRAGRPVLNTSGQRLSGAMAALR